MGYIQEDKTETLGDDIMKETWEDGTEKPSDTMKNLKKEEENNLGFVFEQVQGTFQCIEWLGFFSHYTSVVAWECHLLNLIFYSNTGII